jgi:hypothetical protein
MVTSAGGGKIFAGLRDDPFFFDLTGFQQFLAKPTIPVAGLRAIDGGKPTDTFAGTNILAIVIEAPITLVVPSANSGTLHIWVSTQRNGARVDRMGNPAINTALIPSSEKDAFNMQNPVNDIENRATAINTITTLRNAVQNAFGSPDTVGPLGNLTAEQVAGALLPDVISIDLSKPVQFPNGRRPQDDVIDAALGVVLNRGGATGISDAINANDKTFSTSFPYLADPAMPSGGVSSGGGASSGGGSAPSQPATSPSITAPNTGDAGLLHDSGTMWTLSAALFVVAVAFGGLGTLVAMRQRGR